MQCPECTSSHIRITFVSNVFVALQMLHVTGVSWDRSP